MTDSDDVNVKAIALVCSLRESANESSSELMAQQILDQLQDYEVESTLIRIADRDIKHGVHIDMGNGDEWPAIREQIMEADILLISTPIWVGHPSSYTQQVIERLDAELSETDEQGRLRTYGKVGMLAVVGNEDGAHKVTADVFQALNDVGFTIPAAGAVYWVGEAMQTTDYKDLEETPEKVAASIKSAAANAAHLARLLKQSQYPPAS